MDATSLLHFKTSLQQTRSELMAQIARAERQARVTGEKQSDAADLSTEHLDREFLFAQADANRRKLHTIEQALSRIAEGTFGECGRCGNEIGGARLSAIPWAPYCVRCQEQLETWRIADTLAA